MIHQFLDVIPSDTQQKVHLFLSQNQFIFEKSKCQLKNRSVKNIPEVKQEFIAMPKYLSFKFKESSILKKDLLLNSQKNHENGQLCKNFAEELKINRQTNFESNKDEIEIINDLHESTESEKGLKAKYRIPLSNHFPVIKSFREDNINERKIPKFFNKTKALLESSTKSFEFLIQLQENRNCEMDSPHTVKKCSQNIDCPYPLNKNQNKVANQQIFSFIPDQKEKITPKFCPFQISEERREIIGQIQKKPSIIIQDKMNQTTEIISLNQIALIRKNLRKLV